MQVNSSTAYTPQVNANVTVDSQNKVNQQGDQLIARQKQQQQPEQRENRNTEQQRFDVDQQAIALVEQEQQRVSIQAEKNNGQAQYDQPTQRNQTAVAAYQSVDNQQKRDVIEQSFGVDLYA